MAAKLFLLCMVLVVAGCVPSLHSIVTEETLTYDPAFVGRYEGDDTIWTVTGDPNEKSFAIVIQEKNEKRSLLTAQMVDIQGHRFIDFSPSDDAELNTGDWFNAHILPVHIFWKLDKTENGYSLAGINPDNLESALKAKPQLVKHEIVDDDRIVLTDSPENLQKFLIEGLKVEKFYGDAMELKSVKD